MEWMEERLVSQINVPDTAFDFSQIREGYLLYGKHFSWEKGKSGIVTSVTEKQLTVQYHPGIGNIRNHFFLPFSEVVNQEWEIRWSADLSEVLEYNVTAGGPGSEGNDGSEGSAL